MHNTGLKITEINKDLALLPENRLDEVKNFITFILSQNKDKKEKIFSSILVLAPACSATSKNFWSCMSKNISFRSFPRQVTW
ncbi:hypothetical protein M1M97_00390 [Thermodesulfovibrionales bacterium]|nr:hypothetical protein [Thermodesulfovibrionales bacterium]